MESLEVDEIKSYEEYVKSRTGLSLHQFDGLMDVLRLLDKAVGNWEEIRRYGGLKRISEQKEKCPLVMRSGNIFIEKTNVVKMIAELERLGIKVHD